MTNDYNQLSAVNKELLELDKEVRDALFYGIKNRAAIFRNAGIFVQMSDVQALSCKSHVELLWAIKKALRHSMIQNQSQGLPNTALKRIGIIIRESIRNIFRCYTFSNSNSNNMHNNLSNELSQLNNELPAPERSVYNGKPGTLICDIQDIQESLDVYISQQLYVMKKNKAVAGWKEFQNLLVLCNELNHELMQFELKLQMRE